MSRFIVAAVAIFIATALWQFLAARKVRADHHLIATEMITDMETMAKKLGHADLEAYYIEAKGKEYASTAMTNLRSFVQSFRPKGPS